MKLSHFYEYDINTVFFLEIKVNVNTSVYEINTQYIQVNKNIYINKLLV